MGVPFLGKVPLDPRFSKAGESGQSLFEPREFGARVQADAPSVKALRGIVDQLLASVGEGGAEPETMMDTDDGEAEAEAKVAQLDAMRAQMQALQVKISTLEAEAAGGAGA